MYLFLCMITTSFVWWSQVVFWAHLIFFLSFSVCYGRISFARQVYLKMCRAQYKPTHLFALGKKKMWNAEGCHSFTLMCFKVFHSLSSIFPHFVSTFELTACILLVSFCHCTVYCFDCCWNGNVLNKPYDFSEHFVFTHNNRCYWC